MNTLEHMNTTIVQMYLHYPSLEVRHKVKFVVITVSTKWSSEICDYSPCHIMSDLILMKTEVDGQIADVLVF